MWAAGTDYFAFLISFVVIANHWRTHHRLFRYVARLDRRIVTLNLIWLLMVVITPFATRLLSANGGFGARFTVYAIIQIVTILTFLLIAGTSGQAAAPAGCAAARHQGRRRRAPGGRRHVRTVDPGLVRHRVGLCLLDRVGVRRQGRAPAPHAGPALGRALAGWVRGPQWTRPASTRHHVVKQPPGKGAQRDTSQ